MSGSESQYKEHCCSYGCKNEAKISVTAYCRLGLVEGSIARIGSYCCETCFHDDPWSSYVDSTRQYDVTVLPAINIKH